MNMPIFFLYLNGGICLLGITGHIIALIVLFHLKKKNANTVLLSALSVSDGLVLLTQFVYEVVYGVCEYGGHCACLMNLAPVIPYIWVQWTFLTLCMTWIIVMATMDRYIVVCHPFKGKAWSQKSTGIKGVIGIVFVSFILVLPHFIVICMSYSTYEEDMAAAGVNASTDHLLISDIPALSSNYTVLASGNSSTGHFYNNTNQVFTNHVVTGNSSLCDTAEAREHHRYYVEHPFSKVINNNNWYCPYNIFLASLFAYLIPMGLLLFFNIRIIQELKRARHAGPIGFNPPASDDSHSATINIVAVVTVFIALNFSNFLQKFDCFKIIHINEYLVFILHSIMPALNSAVDFLLYFMFYRYLREEAKRIFFCHVPEVPIHNV